MASSLGKIETTWVRRLISRLSRDRIGRVDLAPVAFREGHVGEHLILGAVHQLGELAELAPQAIGDGPLRRDRPDLASSGPRRPHLLFMFALM